MLLVEGLDRRRMKGKGDEGMKSGGVARYLLPELRQSLGDLATIHCDSQRAVALAKDSVDQRRTRHINVSYHFVRELIISETIRQLYSYVGAGG